MTNTNLSTLIQLFWKVSGVLSTIFTLYNILSIYLTPFNIEAKIKIIVTIKTSICPGFD